jgi:dTDP-4-amino-4,6-dideoxygalactose transaminase
MIKISKCDLTEKELDAVKRVMFENQYLGMSVEVKSFEEELKTFIGNPENHVVCVNTGTSALHAAVQALGIGAGDEVIVPTITYVASFQAVSATGAVAIPCDVTQESSQICLVDAEKRITPRTRAIMPVHYASCTDYMESVYAFAEKYKLRVIEDAAHSFGGTYKDQHVGYYGDVICFSFDGIKNITCGEGGAVVTKDSLVAERVKDLRLLGVQKDTEKRFTKQRSWDFDVVDQGYRYHMSDMNAAIGRVQLTRIHEFRQKTQEIIQYYIQNLTKKVRYPQMDYTKILPHIFCIYTKDRDNLQKYLLEHGIETGLHYKPNHLLTRYNKGYNLPNAEMLYKEFLTIPCHSSMSLDDAIFVTKTINTYFGE